MSFLGLLCQIDRFGRVRLHLKRQLIRRNPRFQFSVPLAASQMVPIQLIDVIQLLSLTFGADFCRGIQMQDRMRPREKFGPLLTRWHKTGTPNPIPTRWFTVTVEQHHKPR